MKLACVLATATLLAFLAACGGAAGSPEDAVKGFIDAVKAGDGAKAVGYLSSNALAEMDEQLVALKDDPAMAVMALTSMGVEVTEDEIKDWDAEDFFAALIETEVMRAQLEEELDVTVTGSEVDGEQASVFITTPDGDEEEVDMILENGQWKIFEMPD
jgi:hypothetical protein